MKLKNCYFILRHGETIYQEKRNNFTYPWPDNSKVKLTKEGEKEIKKVAQKLKNQKIDLIYSSDIYRTAQTAKIVAKKLGIKKINFDEKLRDINLGIYHNRPKKELYRDFPNPRERFFQRPEKGESWQDVRKRMVNFLKEVDKKYKDKKILIISHGDPLWLLEGTVKKWSIEKLIKIKIEREKYIKVGELRKLWIFQKLKRKS